jgi:hypothetical protein
MTRLLYIGSCVGSKGSHPGGDRERRIRTGEWPRLGLKTFQPEDAPLFFGRDAKVQELVDRLRHNFGTPNEERFLALIGASGSGKSPIALAGLIPSVRRSELPESAKWPLVRCRPGARPWENLQIAVSNNQEIALRMAALPAAYHPARGRTAPPSSYRTTCSAWPARKPSAVHGYRSIRRDLHFV